MVEKVRYSDVELEEFRELINEKIKKAQIEYDGLKNSLNGSDNNDTNDTSPTFKPLEECSETLSKEELNNFAARQVKFLEHLKSALIRIDNKTYGICRQTGRLIPKERLRAVPHATLLAECK